MRALSIRQPYAEQILHGTKLFEYRTHSTELTGELYKRVKYLALEEAHSEAEREAWFATTPSELKEPVTITSDEIVIPLADFLVGSELVPDVNTNLYKRMVYNTLPRGPTTKKWRKRCANFWTITQISFCRKELEYAVGLPRNERGEYLFDRFYTNTSSGWRDAGVF